MKVDVAELTSAIVRRFTEAGTPPEHAALVSASLVDADQRGVASHGTARLPMYLDAIRSGAIDPTAVPVVERSSPAASLWNGRSSFGQVSSTILVDHAIAAAAEVGSHIAVCRDTNHYGTAGYWARRAAAAGCLGMSFTTSHPLVAPTRGTRPELGTNPISLALNGLDDEFVLDMATSTAALGKVEVKLREGEPLPRGWAVDAHGDHVDDPAAVYPDVLLGEVGALLPLGGAEETLGGHKGYGLGSLVEILCAVLGGGDDLTPGRPLEDRSAGLWAVSTCFLVVDPAHLAGRERTGWALDRMVGALRASPPADPAEPVIVPGDREREQAAVQTAMIEIHDDVWEATK